MRKNEAKFCHLSEIRFVKNDVDTLQGLSFEFVFVCFLFSVFLCSSTSGETVTVLQSVFCFLVKARPNIKYKSLAGHIITKIVSEHILTNMTNKSSL